MKRRITAIFLFCILIFSLMSDSAYAATTKNWAGSNLYDDFWYVDLVENIKKEYNAPYSGERIQLRKAYAASKMVTTVYALNGLDNDVVPQVYKDLFKEDMWKILKDFNDNYVGTKVHKEVYIPYDYVIYDEESCIEEQPLDPNDCILFKTEDAILEYNACIVSPAMLYALVTRENALWEKSAEGSDNTLEFTYTNARFFEVLYNWSKFNQELLDTIKSYNTNASKNPSFTYADNHGLVIKSESRYYGRFETTKNGWLNEDIKIALAGANNDYNTLDMYSILTSKDSFKLLLELGEETSEIEAGESNIDVDPELQVIENLSTLEVLDVTESIIAQAYDELDSAYMAILAAGGIYVPFSSYVGERDFYTALESLPEDEDSKDALIELYNNNKAYKKPLYKVTLDTDGKVVSNAEIATLQDLLDAIESDSFTGFVMCKGKMVLEDGQWTYDNTTQTLGNNPNIQSLEDTYSPDEQMNGITDPYATTAGDAQVTTSPTPAATSSPTTSPAPTATSSPATTGGLNKDLKLKLAKWLGVSKAYATTTNDLNSIVGNLTQIGNGVNSTANTNTNTNITTNTNNASSPLDTITQGGTAAGVTANNASTNNAVQTQPSDDGSTTQTVIESDEDLTVEDAGEIKDTGTKGAVYANQTISDITRLTEPVLKITSSIGDPVGNMTYMVLNNIVVSTLAKNEIESPATQYIYMNAWGDLVLEDDLVILPGVANPAIYSSVYSPYTAAVMNYYPTNVTIYDMDETDVGAFSAKGKMMWVMPEVTVGDESVKSISLISIDSPYTIGAKLLESLSVKSVFVDKSNYSSVTMLKPDDKSISANDSNHYTGKVTLLQVANNIQLASGGDISSIFPRVVASSAASSTTSVSTATDTTDSSSEESVADKVTGVSQAIDTLVSNTINANDTATPAIYIAYNLYDHLNVDSTTGYTVNQHNLNDVFVINNVILPGLDGTNNPESFTSTTAMMYDKIINNQDTKFQDMCNNLCNSVIDSCSSLRGILSVKTAYNVPIIGDILVLLCDNFILLAIALIVVLMFGYVSNKCSMFTVVVRGAFIIGCSYVAVNILPTYLTYGFNALTNNLAENFAYETIALRDELDSLGIGTTDSNGNARANKNSITLYRYSPAKLGDALEELGIERKNVSGGNIYSIGDNSGIYLENDSIKMKLEALFNHVVITGYNITGSETASTIYQLQAHKTMSDSMEYYTPYYQLMDAFIVRLNRYAQAYNLTREVKSYAKGPQKDYYVVNKFINSPVVFGNGIYVGKDDSEFTTAEAEALDKYFGRTTDWIGLYDVLSNVDDNLKDSLWARTLQDNGYYNSDWSIDEDKIAELVSYVNLQMRKFVIDNDEVLANLSDETAIEVMTLAAITYMNQKAGNFGAELYPMYVNYEDLSLYDLMVTAYANDYNKYINMDVGIASFIQDQYGWINLIVFTVTMLFVFVVIECLTFILPTLYLLFVLMLVVKYILDADFRSISKGFTKLIGLLAVDFVLIALNFNFTRTLRAELTGIAIWITFAIALVSLWVIAVIVTSLLQDFVNMGNLTVNAKITNALDKMNAANVVHQLQVSTTKITNKLNGNSDTGTNASSVYRRSDMDRYKDRYSSDQIYRRRRR